MWIKLPTHVSSCLKITLYIAVCALPERTRCLRPGSHSAACSEGRRLRAQNAEQIEAWNLLRNQAVADLYDDLNESWIIQDHFLKLDIAAALINRNVLLKGENELEVIQCIQSHQRSQG